MRFNICDDKYYIFSNKGLELKSITGKEIKTEKTKFISNFVPIIDKKLLVEGKDNSSNWVEFKILFSDGSESEKFKIPLNLLETIKWADEMNARCFLNPDISKAKEHIASVIRLQCSQQEISTETMTIIDTIGGHKIGNTFLFHAGNELIWSDNLKVEKRPKVFFQPISNKRLVVDESYSEEDADVAMRKIIGACPEAGQILIALNLLCLQWSAFEEIGITPKCNVFLYGLSGVKKTTYASFVTQLFNRDKILERPERFNASIPAVVELMKNVRHGVLVLDDLYPADNPEIYRHQEKTLLEITRIVADGIEPARMRGKKVLKNPPQCGMLFTGEYYVGSGSDAARLFPVEIKTPISSEKLTECQREPLALSTFYRFYLRWYVTKYNEIVDYLKIMKQEYLKVTENNKIHARISEVQFCLESAYKLYLSYREEKKFTTKEELHEEYMKFYIQLKDIAVRQNERSKNSKGNDMKCQIDYLEIIKKILHNQEFVIVKKPSDFDDKEHDGVLHKDFIYFRKEKLLKKMQRYYKNAISEDIVYCLEKKGALKRGSGTSTVQLYGAGKGLRFYAIKREKLFSK